MGNLIIFNPTENQQPSDINNINNNPVQQQLSEQSQKNDLPQTLMKKKPDNFRIDRRQQESESERRTSQFYEKVLNVNLSSNINSKYDIQEIIQNLIIPEYNKPILNSKNSIEIVIQHIVRSEKGKYFDFPIEKVIYLFNVLKQVFQEKNEEQIEIKNFTEKVCEFINLLVTNPDSFKIDDLYFRTENRNVINDFQNQFLNNLYICIKSVSKEIIHVYLEVLFKSSSQQDILESIFKRMNQELKERNLEQTQTHHKILQLLEIFFEFDFVISYFLYHSNLFNQFQNGITLQNNTIFGQILSLSIFSDETIYFNEYFQNNNSLEQLQNKAIFLTEKIRIVQDRLFNLILQIIKNKFHAKKIQFWLEKIVDLNMGKLKTFQVYELTSKNGFLCNVVRLVLTMTQNDFYSFTNIKNSIYQNNIHQLIISSKATLTCSENSIEFETNLLNILNFRHDLYANELPGQSQIENIPIIPFVKVLIGLLQIISPLIKKYNKLCESIVQFQHIYGSTQYKDLFIQKLTYDLIIGDQQYGKMILKFLTFECALCLSSNDIYFSPFDGQMLCTKFEEKPHFFYTQLPVSIVESLPEQLAFLHYCHQDIILQYKNYLFMILNVITLLINQKQWLSNPHLRLQLLDALFVISSNTINKNNKILEIFLQKHPIAHDLIFSGLINGIIENDKINIQEDSYQKGIDKYSFMFKFCQFSQFLVNLQIFSNKLIEFSEKKEQLFLQFAIIYFNNMYNIFKEYIELMKKFINLQQQLEVQIPDVNLNYFKKQQFESMKKCLFQYENLIKVYTSSFCQFSWYTKDIFLKEEILEKTIQSYNFVLKNLKETEKFFNFKKVFNQMLEILDNFHKYPHFLEQLVKDEQNFDILFLENLISQIQDNEQKNKYKRILQKIKDQIQIRVIMDEIALDIPSQFLDPIVNEIMVDPVKLPSSQNILDRLTIKRHLLQDNSDPYTRDKLTFEMVIPQEQLKQQINEYLRKEFDKRRIKQIDCSKC